MMKILIFCLFAFLLFTTSLSAQEKSDSLYARGLQACLEKEVASYSGFSGMDFRNVIVLKNLHITRDLPTQLGEVAVRYLSNYELAEEFKKLSKTQRERGIRFQEIFPLSDRDDKLRFAYNTYWFTYSEKGGFLSRKRINVGHALEGGCHAEIGIDPDSKRFVIENVTLWGI